MTDIGAWPKRCSTKKYAAAKKAWQTWSAMRARAPKKPRARAKSSYGIGRNPSSWRNAPSQRDWNVIIRTDSGWMLPEQSRRALVTRRQLQLLERMAGYTIIDRSAIHGIAAAMGVQYKAVYSLIVQLSEKFNRATHAQLLSLSKQLTKHRSYPRQHSVSTYGRAEPGGGNR